MDELRKPEEVKEPDELPLNFEYGEPVDHDVQRIGLETEYFTQVYITTDTD